MNKAFLLISILFFLVTGCVTTQKNKDDIDVKIDVIAYGLFDVEIEGKEILKDNPLRHISEISRYKLLKETDLIEGKIGNCFGLNYVLIVIDNNVETIPVTFVIKHPLIKKMDSGKERLVDRFVIDKDVNSVQCTGFLFEYDWEIAEGEWIFEMWYKYKKLTEKKFIVQK